MSRLLMLFAALLGGTAAAGSKVIKNDTFTGAGSIYASVSFGEYEGAGVLFEPPASEYPLKIVAIQVLLVPYQQSGFGIGQYEFDLWDSSGGSVPPPLVPNDGGVAYYGRISMQALQLQTSNTMFNRYPFPDPIIVTSGKVFVKLSEILQTSADGTTIALDTTNAKPGANWFFNGGGGWDPMNLPDGGFFNGVNHNWIIRLELEVPDVAVTVTSISPASSLSNVSTNVVLTGTNFELGARAFLGTNELTLSNVTAQTIGANVPAGLTPGLYDVKVRNPGGLEGILTNGYAVLQIDGGTGPTGGGAGGGGGNTGGGSGTGGSSGTEALSITAITPVQTYEGDATSVFITGAGFRAGAAVLIGGTRVEGAAVESGGVISASLKANLLTPGTYDVSVINLSGEQATLSQAFKVLAGSKAKPGCSCSEVDFWPLLVGALALLRRRR